jgi:two-component system sensor histidine kinase RpfC
MSFDYVIVAEHGLDMDALAFARVIKSDPSIHHARLILVASGREDADAGARSGYSAVLPAPVDRTMLFSALHLSRPDAAPGDPSVGDIVEKYRQRQAGRRKLRVLVAEDNLTNQMVIAKILERAGHEVVLVSNGEQALEELKSRPFDVTLMDLHMPVMGGIEAAKLYRFMDRASPRMPIVALTADVTEEARAECEDAGMEACLTKPIDTRRLFELLDELVPAGTPQAREAVDNAAGEEPGTAEPGNGECIDTRVLRELSELGGNGDFVVRLVWTFLKGAREKIRELERAVSSGDLEGARRAAHALKGNSGQIGAFALMRACDRFSGIGKPELDRYGRSYCEAVQEEFSRARAALNRQLQGRDSAVS